MNHETLSTHKHKTHDNESVYFMRSNIKSIILSKVKILKKQEHKFCEYPKKIY